MKIIHKKRPRIAFTLIETLVVIAIVSMLAVVSVESFSMARKWALLDIGLDNLTSTIRQQRQKARIGRTNADGDLFCYGLVFDKTKEKQQIGIAQMSYIAVSGQKADFCDISAIQWAEWRVSEGDFYIKEILLGNLAVNTQLYLVYKPPLGLPLIGHSELSPPSDYQNQLKIILGLRKSFLQREVVVEL